MERLNLILFEYPDTQKQLLPFTYTRPVCDIRVGITTIREKWYAGLKETGSTLAAEHLSAKYPLMPAESNLLINSAVIPDQALLRSIKSLEPGDALIRNEMLIAAIIDHKMLVNFEPASIIKESNVLEFKSDILCISHLWDIYLFNDAATRLDFNRLIAGRTSAKADSSNRLINEKQIFIEEGAKVSCAILNATDGPIYIGKDAEVMEGALIRGPFALGEHAVVKMGAKIYGATTVGPYSKVAGELHNAVIFGYSNKAHDGFLGNSVIGEWCNLGADTNNSNLKNNYGPVKVWNYVAEDYVDSGQQFCGLFMGDHSRCGINTMFNTGTVVGVSANVFGAGFPPKFIPSFAWGGAEGFSSYDPNKALQVAEQVMARRKVKMSEADKEIFKTVHTITHHYRNWGKSKVSGHTT